MSMKCPCTCNNHKILHTNDQSRIQKTLSSPIFPTVYKVMLVNIQICYVKRFTIFGNPHPPSKFLNPPMTINHWHASRTMHACTVAAILRGNLGWQIIELYFRIWWYFAQKLQINILGLLTCNFLTFYIENDSWDIYSICPRLSLKHP